ncbi:MAG TPA: Fur family transcriptional regulator [Kiloniellaceae bacterium]|nr:Fur family transcriptional regulator [Kiloniellaceae bacterium]
MSSPLSPAGGCAHDHRSCVEDALGAAHRLCAERGVRLTEIRRRVLELVWRSHAPVGAYELLKELTKERQSAVPPTVYRALEFLVAQGLVHRIESQNAYIGCVHPGESHCSHFLICRVCGTAAELPGRRIDAAIAATAADCGFLVEGDTVEVTGLCARCRAPAADKHHV